MKKLGDIICKHKIFIVAITFILMIPALLGMYATKINYDILVYLPDDIETVKGQNILAEDFQMGAFSVTILENMSSKEILNLEAKIKEIEGVEKVFSIYDVTGSNIPIDFLPSDIVTKVKNGNSDLMMITYKDSTSAETTLEAVESVKRITKDTCKVGGMSAMVLDTMNLSETEITIYIVIAVLLCIIVLEVSLDSYIVPFLLLANIGISILFNLGTNLILGEISYITKALVAVLQLGVTTDFSIFLYHAYESKKEHYAKKEEAMRDAITETFQSVVGSSLTTIAGFLVLCTMKLTLGRDLGLVMAKGVFLGVVCVLTVFPSLLLVCDRWIEKTKHKKLSLHFEKLNQVIIKQHKKIFVIFLILLIPAYLANSKTEVYYKLDESLPASLDSIVANNELSSKFNIVSPEIILVNKDMKANDINQMIHEIEEEDGIDFVLSFSKLSELGLSKEMLSHDVLSIFESDQYQMLLLNSTYGIATDELNAQVDTIQNIIKKYDKNGILAGEGPLMKDLVSISDQDFKNVNSSSIVCILIIMLLVLKSFSLPILLIIAIETAIFINMAIPYFTDVTLPFVAPIVLGTIQLGATIDYAILLTTNYMKNRKQYDKKKAMEETLNQNGISIVISGLCFFAATFGVGIYSRLEMISSLCTLISRGAIISMIMVILVLPSILLVFDTLIQKTTYLKEETKMKKKFQKLTVMTFLVATCLASVPVSAYSKEETVYVKLNANGNIQKSFVNEHLINRQRLEEMKDVSDLQNILNLNGEEKFSFQNNNLVWNSMGKDIFYQGNTEKELPVSLEITYYLNGEKKNVEEILGQKGNVTIELHYHNQDAHVVSINGKRETLYTPFVVASATMLDLNQNSNVMVSNGRVVSNGNKYMIIGLSTPGLYESLGISELQGLDRVKISFDTEKFELPSMYSIVTPKILENRDLQIFDKMNQLYGSMNLLQTSIHQIEEGATSLVEGASQIYNGNSLIYENLNIVLEKLSELETGIIAVDDGLEQILGKLSETSNVLNGNSSESISALEYLIEQNKDAIAQLNYVNQQLQTTYENYHLKNFTSEQILAFTAVIYEQMGMPPMTSEQVLATNLKFINVKNTYETSYEANNQIIQLLDGNNQVLQNTLEMSKNMNAQITTLLTTLNGYLNEIKTGTGQLVDGTTQLKSGVEVLAKKTGELTVGTKSLFDGASTLKTGITAFNQEGIQVLGNYAYQAKQVGSKVNSLLELSNAYDTFTMKDGSVEGSTKFIYTIDSIKVKEDKKVQEKTKSKDSLWTKVKNLFQ